MRYVKTIEITNRQVIIMLICAVIVICIMSKRNKFALTRDFLPYIIIACYPIVWCGIFYVHCRHGFTRGTYGVSYFSILLWLFGGCKSDKSEV